MTNNPKERVIPKDREWVNVEDLKLGDKVDLGIRSDIVQNSPRSDTLVVVEVTSIVRGETHQGLQDEFIVNDISYILEGTRVQRIIPEQRLRPSHALTRATLISYIGCLRDTLEIARHHMLLTAPRSVAKEIEATQHETAFTIDEHPVYTDQPTLHYPDRKPALEATPKTVHWGSAGTGDKPLCGTKERAESVDFNMFAVNCPRCLHDLAKHGHLPDSHPYFTDKAIK